MITNYNDISTVQYCSEENTFVIINDDNATIYRKDHALVQKWIDQGNTIEDADIDISVMQDQKILQLKTIRDTEVYAPIEYESNLIPCSEKAKIGITGKLAYWNGETNNTFVDVYGNKLTWAKTKFKAVAKLIDQQQTPLFEKAGAIEQQIMAIADIGELKNFDVQVTWDDM